VNETEQKEIFRLTRALMPRTTPEQAELLVREVKDSPFPVVRDAIEAHASTENEGRLSIPWVKCEIERRTYFETQSQRAMRRVSEEAAAAAIRKAQDDADRKEADAAIEEARTFCAAHMADLEAWRDEIVKDNPALGVLTAGKPVFKSTVLVCAIFERFGKQLAEAR
jgi:hypothetical protein